MSSLTQRLLHETGSVICGWNAAQISFLFVLFCFSPGATEPGNFLTDFAAVNRAKEVAAVGEGLVQLHCWSLCTLSHSILTCSHSRITERICYHLCPLPPCTTQS